MTAINEIARAIAHVQSGVRWEAHTEEWCEEMRMCAIGALKALDEAGYVVIPKKPTDEMLTAGHDETPYCHASHEESREIIGERTCYEAIGDVYRVMLAAAAK